MARRKNWIGGQGVIEGEETADAASRYDLDFDTVVELFIKEQKINHRAVRTIDGLYYNV